MLFIVFAFIVALIAAFVAIRLVIHRWQDIALLDPSSLKDEQERERREALIMRRFERMRSEKLLPWKRLGRSFSATMSRGLTQLQARISAMETLYQSAKQPFTATTSGTREHIKILLGEARTLTRDLKWAEAERRYLEALTLDGREADTYRGLGYMYIKQKLYPQAKETFDFLVKMKKADDATYAGLAEIMEANGKLEEANKLRLKAVEMSPRQPHRHAELAEFYVRHGQGKKALAAAEAATKLEPNSAKYLELSLEAAILFRDRKEAERLYDRLRLVSDDTSRFRAWKDKFEEIKDTPT